MSEAILRHAGDLDEEMEEIKRMAAQSENAEQVISFSEGCGTFFTMLSGAVRKGRMRTAFCSFRIQGIHIQWGMGR